MAVSYAKPDRTHYGKYCLQIPRFAENESQERQTTADGWTKSVKLDFQGKKIDLSIVVRRCEPVRDYRVPTVSVSSL